MSKHEHIWGADVKRILDLSGHVHTVTKFKCIECEHKPNHTTASKLRKADLNSFPCDVTYFVATHPGTKPFMLAGYYCDAEKFFKKVLQAENGK